MKKNIATLVLSTVDSKELVKMLVNFLPEERLTQLAEHVSGDAPLFFEDPMLNTDEELVEMIKKNWNHSSDKWFDITIISRSWDAYDQAVSVRFSFKEKRWVKDPETTNYYSSSDKQHDEYQFEKEFVKENSMTTQYVKQ